MKVNIKIISGAFVVVFVTMLFGSCYKENKLECYASNLKKIAATKEYKQIMQSALDTLPNLENLDKRKPFKDSFYVVSSKLDSALFFNAKRTKCLLIILQKTVEDLRLDQIMIVQGILENGVWHFSYDRMPDVPQVTFSINKKTIKNRNINNSFESLSKEGRDFVLNAGTVYNKGCDIDMKYWFGK